MKFCKNQTFFSLENAKEYFSPPTNFLGKPMSAKIAFGSQGHDVIYQRNLGWHHREASRPNGTATLDFFLGKLPSDICVSPDSTP